MDKRQEGGGIDKLRAQREEFFKVKQKAEGRSEVFIGMRLRIKDHEYTFRECIGSGFFGDVWEAEQDGEKGEKVAVKISRPFERDYLFLPEGWKEDDDLTSATEDEWWERERIENVRRLFREVAVLKKLGREVSSPYPHFIDAQFVPFSPRPNLRMLVMVMEMIKGEDFDEMIGREGLQKDPTEVIATALQVVEIIKFTHDRGFVHRDIKPANMIMEEGGRLRMLDLGLVTFRNPKEGVTYQHANKKSDAGSTGFMLPSDPNPFGLERDVYAAGRTIEQMLLGRRALMQLRKESKEDIERISDDGLRKLGEVAQEMTNPDPQKRPQIHEVIEDIKALETA